MAATTETQRVQQWLVSEGNGTISREAITVVSGAGNVLSGTVMGKISASGKYTPYDDDNNDGSETAVGILLNNVDATSADAPGVLIFRFAEVSSAAIVWASTNDATDKTNGIADLSAKHIVFR